ncbi:MAG: nucleoside hydrolase [Gemmatimonadales bacterium]|jgi:pyrimidine-specific ribonucleoside hydrolase
MARRIRVIIDTDPGIDDAVALALAARSPEIELVAVTTTYGNASLEATSRNAAHALQLGGRSDVSVHPGSARPLKRPSYEGHSRHGPGGVGGATVPPAPSVRERPSALHDVLRSLDAPVTLVTLGPLTNLAHALALDHGLLTSSVERHLGVFGNLDAEPNRAADFNAWVDPDAAAAVVAAGIGTIMIGLDVTRRVRVAGDRVAQIAAARDPLASWLGTALEFRLRSERNESGSGECAVHDVVPVAELVTPGLLTLAQLPLSIDLGDGRARGRTSRTVGGVTLSVAVDVDTSGVTALLERVWR